MGLVQGFRVFAGSPGRGHLNPDEAVVIPTDFT